MREDRCTTCRVKLPIGRGNQFIDPQGNDQRVCDKCWKAICDELEAKPGQASIACGLMVGLGIVLLVICAITGP